MFSRIDRFLLSHSTISNFIEACPSRSVVFLASVVLLVGVYSRLLIGWPLAALYLLVLIAGANTRLNRRLYKLPPFAQIRAAYHHALRSLMLKAIPPMAVIMISEDGKNNDELRAKAQRFVLNHPAASLETTKISPTTSFIMIPLAEAPLLVPAYITEVGFPLGPTPMIGIKPLAWLEKEDVAPLQAALQSALPPRQVAANTFESGFSLTGDGISSLDFYWESRDRA